VGFKAVCQTRHRWSCCHTD